MAAPARDASAPDDAAPDDAAPDGAAPDDARLVALFVANELDAERWDHRAHLVVARHVLATEGDVAAALAALRPLIHAHNARTHRPGGRGYHETITRYYLAAVHHLGPRPWPEVLAHPDTSGGAIARHWSPEALATPEARTGWLAPDRSPLPFPAPDGP